ncbi:molybdenum cofactor guanylyltransferase [Kallotenue papyrolyticum]|uniref:molybdenum cofactor guanylyltransferase n=1 Tax=Kallotenue papyrolyticum TaxID=1325125 RepID=UPI0004B4AB0E|nr:molybdenum cofactor guanylyltransferase [Kallotenue papyrolyticum]
MTDDPHSVNAPPLAGIIVAGGRSRRLGYDKRRLRLWGEHGPTLLERTVERVGSLCAEVIVVLNDAEQWSHLPARLVADRYPEGGPLGGIYSGLCAARSEHALVVAADMPLLNLELLRWMIAQPRDYDVLAPRVASGARNRLGVETLHAIYSRACLEPIARRLEAGHPQVIGFFDQVRVRLIEPEVVARFDPAGLTFRNINTPADLEAVQQLLARSAVE